MATVDAWFMPTSPVIDIEVQDGPEPEAKQSIPNTQNVDPKNFRHWPFYLGAIGKAYKELTRYLLENQNTGCRLELYEFKKGSLSDELNSWQWKETITDEKTLISRVQRNVWSYPRTFQPLISYYIRRICLMVINLCREDLFKVDYCELQWPCETAPRRSRLLLIIAQGLSPTCHQR